MLNRLRGSVDSRGDIIFAATAIDRDASAKVEMRNRAGSCCGRPGHHFSDTLALNTIKGAGKRLGPVEAMVHGNIGEDIGIPMFFAPTN